jgi:hypothetical protein
MRPEYCGRIAMRPRYSGRIANSGGRKTLLNLYGRFCPYNPPYNPGHDTLSTNLHIEIFTQRKKPRRKSIEFSELYRFTSRKPGLEISFRMQIWGQWVNKNDLPLMSERTVRVEDPDP